MKKEVIVAIIIGLSLGLVITYGIYQARSSLIPQPDVSPLEASPSPTVNPEAVGSLVVTSPGDETVQSEPGVTVAGTTRPGSFVVIVIDEKETITTADSSGNFSIESTLETGANVIQIIAIDEDGASVEQERTVVYTTEPIDEVSASPSATVDEDAE